ncbi:MAG TPA: xanthine dehydrogenase family protein subunit M [Vicinamibacterales bacterium]|nr:xanthine dehydrogenase family protein subunit M [Vicinamibacterales bacterium]
MKPAPFEYFSPQTLDDALALLAEHGGDARPLAGGQSLIPAMNFRLATPSVLVDLNAIDGLSRISECEGALRIGGMARHRTLERSDLVAQHAPLVSAAMPFVAHPAIRTRGTLGGSLAHADPAAELPAVMLALEARFTLRSRDRTRVVAARDFFVGLFTTAIEPGELLTEIEIPALPPRSGVAFQEISRRHGDFALAGAAAIVSLDTAGRCAAARVALLSLSDRPVIAEHVSTTLVGHTPSEATLRAAGEAAAEHDIDPTSDLHASGAYRRQLAAVLVRRALGGAFAAARTP